MTAPAARSWSGSKNFFFWGTVALAYVPTLWMHGLDLTTVRGAACLALGVAYLVLGFFADCDQPSVGSLSPRHARLIALAITAVLAGILFTGRMHQQLWLCTCPAAAVVLKLVRRWEAVLAEVVIAAVLVAALATYTDRAEFAVAALQLLVAQAFVIVFTLAAIRASRARDEAIRLTRELETANGQLRAQADQIAELAMIQERNRLARDIHDGLGHYLTTIHVQLAAARALSPVDPARAVAAVEKAHRLAEDALLEVRRSVGTFKAEGPAAPLSERLRELAASVDAAPDTLSVAMTVLGEPPRLSSASAVALYRAAQEGLTNVRKHAAARHAVITLDGTRADRVVLSVVDDGCGTPADRPGHGLAGLRERLNAVGGEVRAGNEPGGGFRLEAHVPVPTA